VNDKHKTKYPPAKKPAKLRRQIAKPGKPAAGKKQKNPDLNRSFLNPDDISDSLIIIDDKKRVITVNREFSKLWGYSSKEVLGKSVFKLFPPEEKQKHLSEMQKAFSTKKLRYFETTALTKLHDKVPVSVKGTAIFDKNGKLERFIALFRDITLQKNTEKNLIESKNFLNNIFTSIPDGISILNEKMEIVGVNTAMEKWYAHSMPLIGKKCYQAYHGKTKACDLCPCLRTLRTGKPAYEMVPKTGKQGKIMGWLDLYAFPWYDSETGKLKGVIEYVRDITERKRAEEEIAKFKFICDNSADAHFLIARDAQFQYINKTACKMFGYSEEELLALGVPDVDIVYDLKAFQALFDKIQKETVPTVETRNKRKDGSIFHTEITVTGHKIGGKSYMFAVLRDITERKKAEETLQASEDKFRSLAEQSLTGITLIQDGKFVYVNPRLAEIFGFQQEKMIGLTVLDLVTEADRERVRENFRKRLSGEVSSLSYSFHGLKKDSSEVAVEVYGRTTMHNGRPAIMGTLLDITERKRAEDELRKSEEHLHVILESTGDGILAVNAAGKTIMTNQRFAGLWRIPQTLIDSGDDKAMLDFVLDQLIDPDEFLKKVKSLYGTAEIANDTILFKDGRTFERYSTPLLYAGAVIGRLWSFRDITERTKAENALREAKNEIEQWSRELEDRVNEKTAELEKSREQLIQSEKLSAMGKLSAGLAHELNSPLAGLLPLLDKYRNREKEGTNEFREMTLMLKACEHMARIVRDFSAFSRRPSEERTRLNMNDVLDSTLSFTIDSLEKKEIKVVRQYGEALPDIMGNKTEIQQVVINLLTNARDAMPNGGLITIKTLLSTDKENVILEFIDTGKGIEIENLNKIFDPFFTTKSIAEGTGLGLTVSYGIIKNHSGDISAESKPGKGARFIILLPVV
jgi:PAS domain S-box-containing protein